MQMLKGMMVRGLAFVFGISLAVVLQAAVTFL